MALKSTRLTELTKAAGCAAKIAPGELAEVLRGLPNLKDPHMLIGYDTSDDAAVYKVSDDLAIINTVDFFPPMVDDPFTFGQVAAANALSDVWAMGGRPVMAMNLLCFPNCLGIEVAGEILAGGSNKAMEAGCTVAGGHSIADDEPKYGMSVMGFVHPDEILANSTAQEGDLLVLTKPIGVGVLNTAIKGGAVTDEKVKQLVIDNMRTLNKYTAEAARGFNIHACTDVTGFSLAGHTCEMARGSGLTAVIYAHDVPTLPQAKEMARLGMEPAGAFRNQRYFGKWVDFADDVETAMLDLMYDPQTSGGLLFALPEMDANLLVDKLAMNGIRGAIVGEFRANDGKALHVLR